MLTRCRYRFIFNNYDWLNLNVKYFVPVDSGDDDDDGGNDDGKNGACPDSGGGILGCPQHTQCAFACATVISLCLMPLNFHGKVNRKEKSNLITTANNNPTSTATAPIPYHTLQDEIIMWKKHKRIECKAEPQNVDGRGSEAVRQNSNRKIDLGFIKGCIWPWRCYNILIQYGSVSGLTMMFQSI